MKTGTGLFYMLHMTIRVVSVTPLVLLFLCLSISMLCAETLFSASAHQPRRPQAFDGTLRLTRAPRIGEEATLILSIRSNLPETIHARVQFRLPNGISPRSTDSFDRAYFPPYAPDQHFSVLVRVRKQGVYPLQASIYATLANGQTVIEHFYTYLRVTPGYSQDRAIPFDESVDNLPLETQARFRRFRAPAGEVTVRGSVVYFNDNEGVELPIHHPQVLLYLEAAVGEDIKIDETIADDRGEYIFENLTHSELNSGAPRNLYIVVRFDNHVLSIENPGTSVHEFASETVRNVPDGETIVHLSINSRNPNRALGYIFNTVQHAHSFLLNRLGWERERPVHVIWPGAENISYYTPHLIGDQVTSETINISYRDQWTRILMLHEYGHTVMTAAYGYNYDSVPQGTYQGSHRLETVSDTGFAFNEGWAEFMEAAVDNRALNVTGYLDQTVPNIESNRWWTGQVEGVGSNTKGETVEGTVASILWDIFDTADSIDHQPQIDDDGISDRTDLLWEIITIDKPQSITDIAIAWRRRGLPVLEELEEIYATHHTLFRPNVAPGFQFTAPSAQGGISEKSFQITWEASDPDDKNFTIALFFDRDNHPGGATLIQSGLSSDHLSFTWNTHSLAEGTYYLRAIVTDSQNPPTEVYSDGFVIVDHTPLLPPVITSNTHPDFNRWYADNSPQLELLTPPTMVAGQQYSFILNREPETVPDTRPDALVRSNSLMFTGLGDGSWWVHVRARDALGYWTDASHFGFKIDSTPPPTVSNLNWLVEEAGNSPEFTLEWDAVDDTSRIIAYHVQIDVDSSDFQSGMLFDQNVGGGVTRHTFTGELNTTYYARIKAENHARLSSHDWSAITPGVMLSEPSPWNVNRDATVNILDLVLVASHLGKTIDMITNPNFDVNGDGVVDIADLALVARHFGENTNAAPSLARTMHDVLHSKFDTGPRTQSIATHPIYMEIDVTRVQKALFALHRQPHLPSRSREAIEALISWVEGGNLQAHLNSKLPPVAETRILPVYPNPFNPEVWIPYELATPAGVQIQIYSASGRSVRRLNLGQQPAGRYHRRDNAAYWDGRNEAGDAVASGLYVYAMRVAKPNGEHNAFVQTMVLLK